MIRRPPRSTLFPSRRSSDLVGEGRPGVPGGGGRVEDAGRAAGRVQRAGQDRRPGGGDRKSTRLNSSHSQISYAVFCLKKKKILYTHSHMRLKKLKSLTI